MKRILSMLAAAALLLAFLPAQAADEESSWEGLQKVKSQRMDSAYLLPGADFRGYTQVMLDPIEVSFRRNFERDINRAARSTSARLTAEEADAIRQSLAEAFGEVLVADFAAAGYEVVTAPGPEVLRLKPVLMDVYINAPDTMRAARSYTFTLEAGEATFALEARDSESGQLLGRAVDKRRTGKTGSWTWTTEITNRAEFTRLFRRWSGILIDGLESLKAASPIQPKAKK